eukprot:15117760-Ditylum_brightwellii.AAC.1
MEETPLINQPSQSGWGLEAEDEQAPVMALGSRPGGTTLVDARNGFNELSRLAMLWTVHHRWTAGARFVFNCYHHWA